MQEKLSKEKLHSALFMNLVMSLYTAAMQQLGKLKSPVSDKIERDLQQAHMTIEMLDMLAAKTDGNLADDERSSLTRIIADLKLNYVDEVNKKPAEAPADKTETAEPDKGAAENPESASEDPERS